MASKLNCKPVSRRQTGRQPGYPSSQRPLNRSHQRRDRAYTKPAADVAASPRTKDALLTLRREIDPGFPMIQWEIDIGIGMSSPFSRRESCAGDLPAATPRIHRPTSGRAAGPFRGLPVYFTDWLRNAIHPWTSTASYIISRYYVLACRLFSDYYIYMVLISLSN